MEPFFGLVGRGKFQRRNFTKREGQPGFFLRRSPLDVTGCFHCDEKGNIERDCSKPLSFPRAAN